MKPDLGRSVVWLMLMMTTLLAQAPYEWSVTSNKSQVVVGEAVVLHYTCRFSDEGELYTIELRPPRKSDGFRLLILNEDQHRRGGVRVNDFVFLIFPTRPGKQEIAFKAMMRQTTRASIENTVIGRDNVQQIDYDDVEVALPVVSLDVATTSATLVGKFTLDVQVDKTKVKAFEPVQVVLRVEGEGDLDELRPFEIKIPGVKVFSEAPQRKLQRSKAGFRGKSVQRFALVSDKPFDLEAFKLDYYDVHERRLIHLQSEPKHIEVTAAAKPETLLDHDVEEERSWEWDWSYLNYLLTFVSGVLLGVWYRRRPPQKTYDETLVGKIRTSRDAKALAMILVINADGRFAPLISRLERDGKKADLAKAKREALELVDAQVQWDVPEVSEGLMLRSAQLALSLLKQLFHLGVVTLNTIFGLLRR